MKRILVTFAFVVSAISLMGYVEFGVGSGFASTAVGNNGYVMPYDTSVLAEADLRAGFQPMYNFPLYLVFDLNGGWNKVNVELDRASGTTSLLYDIFQSTYALTPAGGFLFKPNSRIKTSATVGYFLEKRHYENDVTMTALNTFNEPETIKTNSTTDTDIGGLTFNSEFSANLSKQDRILLAGVKYTASSLNYTIENEDHYGKSKSEHRDNTSIFEYAVRGGYQLDNIFVLGALSGIQSNTQRFRDGKPTLKAFGRSILFGPEVVYYPLSELQISSSVSFSMLEQGAIFEIGTEYELGGDNSGFAIGAKYINANGPFSKYETMLNYGVFAYIKFENPARKLNNRLPYMNSIIPYGRNIQAVYNDI